jgi:hypothetical protein
VVAFDKNDYGRWYKDKINESTDNIMKSDKPKNISRAPLKTPSKF